MQWSSVAQKNSGSFRLLQWSNIIMLSVMTTKRQAQRSLDYMSAHQGAHIVVFQLNSTEVLTYMTIELSSNDQHQLC